LKGKSSVSGPDPHCFASYTFFYLRKYILDGQKQNLHAAFTTNPLCFNNTAKPPVFCKYRNERNYFTKKPHQNLWSPRSVAYSKPSPLPEIIDPVFAKTSQNARFLLSEYERFGLVFTKTRVYKFGHLRHSDETVTLKEFSCKKENVLY
jgi:hypothetical protein